MAAKAESGHAGGVALVVTSSASNQAGAALGAMAFPAIGPVGVVAVRQLVAGLVLGVAVRPPLRGLRWDQRRPILALALVFSVMNLALYLAVDRIGLGLAVVLEFTGPLAVAVISSRRPSDIACAVVAAAGVVVVTRPGPSTDLVGIGLALTAALGWAGYILLNRIIGQRVPGIGGTAAASVVTAACWIPVAAVWFWRHPPTVLAIALAVACGLLASVVPYVTDLVALRRVPPRVFGVLTSLNPVWAAFAGWLLLRQGMGVADMAGIALIVGAGLVVSTSRWAPRSPAGEPPTVPAARPRARGSDEDVAPAAAAAPATAGAPGPQRP